MTQTQEASPQGKEQRQSFLFLEERARILQEKYGSLDGLSLLRPLIEEELKGRLALTSSFGAESAVLLHMVAQIDKNLPVIFLDTGKLFEETYNYVSLLSEHLGLTQLRIIRPADEDLMRDDEQGDLWNKDPDRCCHIRKVLPLERLFESGDYDAWITGRKRFHGDLRLNLEAIEYVEGKIKINPLVHWGGEEIRAAFLKYSLPLHPLVGQGYPSIGCHHCTHKVEDGDDPRSGRWKDLEKTECGIHRASWAKAGGHGGGYGSSR